MTIDEAIQHAKDVAREEKYYAQFEKSTLRTKCIKCAGEHEQLAEWLEELKELRKIKEEYQKGMDSSYATFKYNKAIDDVVKQLEDKKQFVGTREFCQQISQKYCNNRNCFHCCVDYLINIVKAGGTDDSNKR